jgi:hypothetical protein
MMVFLFRLYTTKVKIGSPPKEFNVQIDTGSDILWVNCNTCSNCPRSSGLGVSIFNTSFFKWILLICRVVVVLSPWEIRFRFGA